MTNRMILAALAVGLASPALAGDEVRERTHLLSVDVTQALPAGFFASTGYTYATIDGDVQAWSSHTAVLELGWQR